MFGFRTQPLGVDFTFVIKFEICSADAFFRIWLYTRVFSSYSHSLSLRNALKMSGLVI